FAYLPLAEVFKPWQWVQFGPFAFQPGFTLVYLVYFFAGLGVGACGLDRGLLTTDGMLARRWAVCLAAAGAGFLLWIISSALSMRGASSYVIEVLANFGLVVFCGTACFALAATFLRFGCHRSSGIHCVSSNAYGI